MALTLLHDPQIVFLDEPTLGLDVVAKTRIRECICDVNKQKGTTFILTTHDIDDIDQTCTKLIMIDRGINVSQTEDSNGPAVSRKQKT